MGLLRRGFRTLCVTAVAGVLAGSSVRGQDVSTASSMQPQTVVDVLHQLSDKADVIFAGQVVAVRRPNGGVVEVEFRVDQAIRGCAAGTPYVLREWAGLWAGDTQRYRVGQRLLMLLHGPSAAGMSSPVGGLDGAIPIRQGGAAVASAEIASPRQPPFVDLRWLGVKVPRVVAYREGTSAGAKIVGASVAGRSEQQTSSGVTTGSSASGPPASVPAQQASVEAVIGMLTSWQKARHVAP
jgi:hypothetical protein